MEGIAILAQHRSRIEAIYQSLRKKEDQGHHCFYQRQIDYLTIIPRTEQLDEFGSFLDFLDPGENKLEIMCYMGQRFRNTRHHFELKKSPTAVFASGNSATRCGRT